MAVVWEEKCVEISKSLTYIDGLDQITGGGLPKRGATLAAGNVGCGKTLLATQFLEHKKAAFSKTSDFYFSYRRMSPE